MGHRRWRERRECEWNSLKTSQHLIGAVRENKTLQENVQKMKKQSSPYFPFCTIKDKTCLTFKCQLDKPHFERTAQRKGKSCYSS